MTKRTLEQRLSRALDHAAPNDLEEVLSRLETRKGNVIPMTKKNTSSRKWISGLVAACLTLVLAGGGGGYFYQQANAVTTVVSLDVNPSIELRVNKNEVVKEAVALNADAEVVLKGMDLEGTGLNVAVNAIVGSLLQNGYLDRISSAIFVSVEDKDLNRATRLEQSLTGTVDLALQNASSNAGVLSQTVAQSDALDAQAKENHISTGKTALVNRVLALNSQLSFEALAALSIDELNDMLESGKPVMPIGKDAALQAALQAANLSQGDVTHYEVDADLDDQPAHYEVELEGSFGEREYRVDARTGAILTTLSGPSSGTVSGGGASGSPSGGEGTAGGSDTPVADIGADAAKAAALAHAGLTQSQITGLRIERDWDDGVLEYEIEFKAGGREYEYTVRASDGKVLEGEKEWDDDTRPSGGTSGSAPSGSSGGTTSSGASSGAASTPAGSGNAGGSSSATDIGTDAAKAIALKHAGVSADQASFLRAERERDDGVLEYEIEFNANGREYDYTVRASDGKILEWDNEIDDDARPTGGTSTGSSTGNTSGSAGSGNASSGSGSSSSGSASSSAADIGSAAAKAAALKKAGLSESQVTGLKVEKDRDDGVLEYEVEFRVGRVEYSCTVRASDGKILEFEKDTDD